MSKQIYAVRCYTCEHNGQETCKGCNTILNGQNKPYENWQLREDLCQKDEQIADLQHRLEVAEKALEKANWYVDCLEVALDGQFRCRKPPYNERHNCINCECMKLKEKHLSLYFKTQAERELKGE